MEVINGEDEILELLNWFKSIGDVEEDFELTSFRMYSLDDEPISIPVDIKEVLGIVFISYIETDDNLFKYSSRYGDMVRYKRDHYIESLTN